MKILMITFEFPPQPGGIGTYCFQMAKNLAMRGNSITILAHTNYMSVESIREFDSQQHLGIIRYAQVENKILKIINRIYVTWNLVRKGEYQILFVPYPNASILGWFFKKIYKIPYVLMGHGSEFLYKSFVLRQSIRIGFNGADLILTNSKYTTDLLRKSGIRNAHVVTIPLGADETVYDRESYDQHESKKRLGLVGKKVILTVGSLSKRKGHTIVIRAVASLCSEIPELIYLIVGRGREEENLRNLIRENHMENHVRLVDFVSSEDLLHYYAACDIFILNSTTDDRGDTEGFGIVLVEAALMGKPVIGTTGCGIDEAVEHMKSGILVPPENVASTARALRTLLMNPELAKKMGEFGHHRAREKFTWAKTASMTENAIKRSL